MVIKFLEDVTPHHETLSEAMGMSQKQVDVMKKWRENAEKAAALDKPPSKSVLKTQQKANQKKRGEK
jgi:hypothetical protein